MRRTVALRNDQTLVDLHDVLQGAFEWDDDHLYSFWPSGKFWDREGKEYTHPFVLEDVGYGSRPRSAMVRLDRLRLVKGQKIAYVFDFGDEWRVLLTLSAIRADDGAFYPQILAVVGDAPPQYPEYDDEADAA